jgi:hypothetical protein
MKAATTSRASSPATAKQAWEQSLRGGAGRVPSAAPGGARPQWRDGNRQPRDKVPQSHPLDDRTNVGSA